MVDFSDHIYVKYKMDYPRLYKKAKDEYVSHYD